MGDGSEQIGIHFFSVHFKSQLFLLLNLCGQGTDQNADNQHNHNSQRVTGICNIKGPERVREKVVYAERATD